MMPPQSSPNHTLLALDEHKSTPTSGSSACLKPVRAKQRTFIYVGSSRVHGGCCTARALSQPYELLWLHTRRTGRTSSSSPSLISSSSLKPAPTAAVLGPVLPRGPASAWLPRSLSSALVARPRAAPARSPAVEAPGAAALLPLSPPSPRSVASLPAAGLGPGPASAPAALLACAELLSCRTAAPLLARAPVAPAESHSDCKVLD